MTARERVWLGTVAGVGLLVVNGLFVYAALSQPETVRRAFSNPFVVALMIETLVLLGVLSYLLHRWKLSRLHWGWFVILSLIGSMAFALPMALLWDRQPDRSRQLS